MIEEYFRNTPVRLKITRLLIEYGFSVKDDGKIYCGPVEISPMKIGRALGVDRRVVKKTVDSILSEPELREIFIRIKSAGPFFGDVAKQLGYGVLVITAKPETVGIVAKTSSLIAEEGIGIRQIIAEDPELYPEPKLTIITDGEIPGRIIPNFLKIKGVNGVTFY
jgi:predicted regulator of amino acid metabolism with ACT domain